MTIKDPTELYHKKIKILEKKVKELEEENESLWFILNEIQEKALKDQNFKKIFDVCVKKLRDDNLRTIETSEIC